jgi:hypothetical protein
VEHEYNATGLPLCGLFEGSEFDGLAVLLHVKLDEVQLLECAGPLGVRLVVFLGLLSLFDSFLLILGTVVPVGLVKGLGGTLFFGGYHWIISIRGLHNGWLEQQSYCLFLE